MSVRLVRGRGYMFLLLVEALQFQGNDLREALVYGGSE